MRTTCDQCRTRFRGEGNRTSTRVLCDRCYTTLLGFSAGALAGQGSVTQAISTAGWFSSIVSRAKKKK